MSADKITLMQEKLKEIFQYEKSDLDFGIYKILNLKRKEIQEFIDVELKDLIKEKFAELESAESDFDSDKLEKLRVELEEATGEEISILRKNPNPKGKLKEYIQLEKDINSRKNLEDVEEDIYDRILTFFSRYYLDGDFISKGIYSNANKYSIPYNGDEVYLHWANKDQYYVKTTEDFKDFKFVENGYEIHFKIKEADVEQNNNKSDEKKLFIYLNHELKGKTLVFYFDYRGINDSELSDLKELTDFKTADKKSVLVYNFIKMRKDLGIDQSSLSELDFLNQKYKNKITLVESESSVLKWYLNKYISKNSSDYFIHKDLKGFLLRELDFYIKNEMFNIDKVGEEDEIKFNLKKIKTFKEISSKIIEFLAQIEDFQLKLWEKKKFVVNTDYCIAIKLIKENVDSAYYNDLKENLFSIMKNNHLIEDDFVNTIKFTYCKPRNNIFVKEVLIKKEKIEIKYKKRFFEKDKAEKYLNKLEENYKLENEKVESKGKLIDCWFVEYSPENLPLTLNFDDVFYIETSYFDEDFKLKIISEITKRINLDESINGYLIKSENWQGLNLLFEKFKNKIDCVYIDPPFNTENDEFIYKDSYKDSSWISFIYDRIDFAIQYLKPEGNFYLHLDHNANHLGRLLLDNSLLFQREIIWNTGENISGFKSLAPNWIRQHDSIYFYSKIKNNTFNKPWTILNNEKNLEKIPSDIKSKLTKTGKLDILGENKESLYLEQWKNNNIITIPISNIDVKAKGDIWNDVISFQYSEPGIITESVGFATQKPESLLRRIIQSSSMPNGYILDFFLGSGTTVTTAHKLGRKWIGIEMGNHIENNALLRLKSVIVGDELTYISKNMGWKGGGIFKYQTLEQYEDTLDNISFEDPNQLALARKDYKIKYMLNLESRNNNVFMNLEHLESPFDYKLNIDGKETNIDLVETFNYVAGIYVSKIEQLENKKQKYIIVKGKRKNKKVIVIWRNVKDIDRKEDKKFIETLISNEDEIFVNSDSLVKNATPLDIIFKEELFGGI